MSEEPQFHITVVTQQRRKQEDAKSSPGAARRHSADRSGQSRSEAAKTAPAQEQLPSGEHTARTGSHSRSHSHSGSRGSGSHRRHYKDYGTLELGSLNGGETEEPDFTADPNGPTPTQGELQRQFYNKYNAILNRRYFTRNKGKVTRVILIAVLVGVIFLVSIIGISAIRGNVAETLERPEVSTIPVETLDLG